MWLNSELIRATFFITFVTFGTCSYAPNSTLKALENLVLRGANDDQVDQTFLMWLYCRRHNCMDAIPTIQDNKSFATRRHVMTAWKFEYIYWTTFSVLILQFLSLALLFAFQAFLTFPTREHTQLIFGLALAFLYFLELLKIFISKNSLLLIILITIKRLVVSCLLVMVLFLLKTDPVSLMDNGLLQILQTYLKSLFIPSEEGKHSIADFIKGFCRPMSYVGRYDSFLYVAIRLLLDAGADPNILDVNGETCLHLLARHPSLWVRINCSKLLKEAGADLTIANCHGESFYCDQGWVWTTAPKKLTCSAALQVPQLLRHSKRLLAAQNIPKHQIK